MSVFKFLEYQQSLVELGFHWHICTDFHQFYQHSIIPHSKKNPTFVFTKAGLTRGHLSFKNPKVQRRKLRLQKQE